MPLPQKEAGVGDPPAPPWWQSRGHPLALVGQHVGVYRRYGYWLAEGRAVERSEGTVRPPSAYLARHMVPASFLRRQL